MVNDPFKALSHPIRRGIVERLLARLSHRLVDGVLTVAASEYRSQHRNRQAARSRLAELVTAALQERTESPAVEPVSVAILGAAEALGRWWLRTGELSAARTAELLIRTIEPGLRKR